MATDRARYTVSVTNEMFEQIEDFRFKNSFHTRSDATTELILLGLEALKKQQEEQAADEKGNAPQKG
ncbi:MAG: ribbon-helix-helix domain-containing protein [Clostridiales bacterium]|nr:ribbon-helix-helix domain-containing protein [Clostridiales bacterium]